ncbi:unnamed protein product [Phyllotreta striolata]|uniref:lysoplasmalogenase n=1 Tax=Phyllotreta striolata TaxID=444603 RepID=A0A9N9TI65_PHYSR|nr:unnamed protein product [Phyllotreta striolata]
MSSFLKVIKNVGPKLVPFLKTVAIYFVIFIPQDKPSIFSVILKCLPIISLMLFVLLNGMSLKDEYKYSRRILLGLVFCCIGDALLLWNQYFDLGMLAFTAGHIQYIRAFGFEPLQLPIGAALYSVATLVVLYLLPDLYGVFVVGVPIYVFVIATMLWRAIARVQFFEDLWTWSKLCTCAGSILFALSDFLIGIDRFKYKIEYSQALIMSTYYAAQVGIALSVIDATASIKSE